MGLNKVKLGEVIELYEQRNSDNEYSLEQVRGIATSKKFIDTKANMDGVPLTSYKIVKPNMFAYVADTSRRGDKISLAYNDTSDSYLISAISTVFKVSDDEKLLSEFLYIFFNRPEFDRYSRFNSWGSARETFSWEDMCDIELELPDIEIQQMYVDIYKAMVKNQQCYERGLDDLKLVCDAYIEDLRRKMPCEEIGKYIEQRNVKNNDGAITLFQGVNVEHIFTEPKRIAEDFENGSVVKTGQFAFNKVMKAHNTKLPIALREGADCVVSNSYEIFEVINIQKLLSKYLLLWLNRTETQRYAGFISCGTTRDIFSFEDMCEVKIPIPDIKIQQSIVNIYNAYNKRKEINEKLKLQIKDICPILIKGSIEEAKEAEHVHAAV